MSPAGLMRFVQEIYVGQLQTSISLFQDTLRIRASHPLIGSVLPSGRAGCHIRTDHIFSDCACVCITQHNAAYFPCQRSVSSEPGTKPLCNQRLHLHGHRICAESQYFGQGSIQRTAASGIFPSLWFQGIPANTSGRTCRQRQEGDVTVHKL